MSLLDPFVLRLRRGTAAQWSLANYILSDGEPGYVTDLNKYKIGDGVTPWNELDFVANEEGPPGPIGPEGPKGDPGDFPDVPQDGVLYGRQDSDWVPVPGATLDEAPVDGSFYGRQDSDWVSGDDRYTTQATHAADVDALTSAVSGKEAAGAADAAVSAHVAASNPHAQYLLDAPSNGVDYGRRDGAWVAVSAGGGGVAGIGGNVKNVLEYGADPTGVNNSRAAFTAAINAVASVQGTVIVPAGTYKLVSTSAIDDLVVVPTGVTLIGYGRTRGGGPGGTVLLASGACRSVVRTTGYRASVQSLTADGDYVADYAIYISGPEGRFVDFQARNADYGVFSDDTGSDTTSSRRIDLNNFHIEGSRIGLWQEGPDWIVSYGRIIPEGSNPDYMVVINGTSGQYSQIHTTGSGPNMISNFWVNGASNNFTDLYVDTCTTGPLLKVDAWSNRFSQLYLYWGTGSAAGSGLYAVHVGASKQNNVFVGVKTASGSAGNVWDYGFYFGNITSANNTVVVGAVLDGLLIDSFNHEALGAYNKAGGVWSAPEASGGDGGGSAHYIIWNKDTQAFTYNGQIVSSRPAEIPAWPTAYVYFLTLDDPSFPGKSLLEAFGRSRGDLWMPHGSVKVPLV